MAIATIATFEQLIARHQGLIAAITQQDVPDNADPADVIDRIRNAAEDLEAGTSHIWVCEILDEVLERLDIAYQQQDGSPVKEALIGEASAHLDTLSETDFIC